MSDTQTPPRKCGATVVFRGAASSGVHVTPTTGGGAPVEAELQPEPAKGKSNSRKVIYTASRTAAWVAESRITDLPVGASS